MGLADAYQLLCLCPIFRLKKNTSLSLPELFPPTSEKVQVLGKEKNVPDRANSSASGSGER